MEKVTKLNFTKLWNSEHPLVYNRVIAIVEKHNPETLHLAGPLTRAKSHLPGLDKIEAQERKNVLTQKIFDADSRRDSIIWAFNGMTDSFITANMPGTYESAITVKAWLDKHDTPSIPNANYTSANERTSDMIADARRTPEIMTAIGNLHQTAMLDELENANNLVDSLFMQRKADKSQIETVDAKSIRSAADKDLRRLFSFIELYQIEYPDLDFKPLTKELNLLLSYYKTQLAARAGRRAKGNNIEDEQPIDTPKDE